MYVVQMVANYVVSKLHNQEYECVYTIHCVTATSIGDWIVEWWYNMNLIKISVADCLYGH